MFQSALCNKKKKILIPTVIHKSYKGCSMTCIEGISGRIYMVKKLLFFQIAT